MKTLILFFFFTGILFSQNDSVLNCDVLESDIIVYRQFKLRDIKTNDEQTGYSTINIPGVSRVISLSDSNICVWNGKTNIVEINNLKSIKIHKGNYFWKGFLIGSLAGLCVSSALCLASGEQGSGFWDFWGPSLVVTLLSGLTGGFIGMLHEDFNIISFNNKPFDKKESELLRWIKSSRIVKH